MLHISPYVLLLVFCAVAGVMSTIWGWSIMAKAKRSKSWPTVEAKIVSSKRGPDKKDPLPEVVFNYVVEGRGYTKLQDFPPSVTPDREFTDAFLEKYPVGTRVPVYYDPLDPEQATLDTGFISGDRIVFALGIAMTLFGVISLLFRG